MQESLCVCKVCGVVGVVCVCVWGCMCAASEVFTGLKLRRRWGQGEKGSAGTAKGQGWQGEGWVW